MAATVAGALRRHRVLVLSALLGLVLVGVLVLRVVGAATAAPRYDVPHDPQIEAALGVRFTQAAVVGDGGLVELRYVVLDVQKASAFQNDTKHPPQLRSERSGTLTWRAALMKQGHELRAGQTYYVLYLNNKGTIRRGDKIEIGAGNRHIAHVPVR